MKVILICLVLYSNFSRANLYQMSKTSLSNSFSATEVTHIIQGDHLLVGDELRSLVKDSELIVPLKDVTLLKKLQVKTIETVFRSKHRHQLCDVFSSYTTSNKSLPDVLSLIFHIPSERALDISATCKMGGQNSSGKVIDRRAKNKKYFVVFSQSNHHDFSSWTTRDGATYFFITPTTSIEEFVRAVIHELYIAQDKLVNQSRKDLTKIFPELEYQKDKLKVLLSPKQLERFSGFNRRYFGQFNLDYYSIYSYPLLKYSLLVMRANQFEDDVLSTSGWFGHLHTSKKGTCKETLAYTLGAMIPSQQFILAPELIMARTQLDKSAFAPSLYEWSLLLMKFNELDLSVTHPITNKQMDLCETLSEPIFGPHSLFINRGPRPRLTGGWKTINSEEILIDIEDIEEYQFEIENEFFIKESPKEIQILVQEKMNLENILGDKEAKSIFKKFEDNLRNSKPISLKKDFKTGDLNE